VARTTSGEPDLDNFTDITFIVPFTVEDKLTSEETKEDKES
jgi:hypothetical protein